MRIFIPTYGRHDKQHTFQHLPVSLKQKVTFVVQKQDFLENRRVYEAYNCQDILVLPSKIKTIAPTRQFIMKHAFKKMCKLVMLDDDLRFDTRREDDHGKFRTSQNRDIIQLFKHIENGLDKYAHVGVVSREGGNRFTMDPVLCTRMMRVLAYDVDLFNFEKIKFDRLPLQEDFDVTLQLLRKGYENLVLTRWVQGQGTSNAAGGCSTFRTIEMHNENAKKLAELHSPFVKVVEKQTKGAWNGKPRLDVMVQWKKAFMSD